MSKSITAVLWPNRARPEAKFALVVVFPTPPLPEVTTMICVMILDGLVFESSNLWATGEATLQRTMARTFGIPQCALGQTYPSISAPLARSAQIRGRLAALIGCPSQRAEKAGKLTSTGMKPWPRHRTIQSETSLPQWRDHNMVAPLFHPRAEFCHFLQLYRLRQSLPHHENY
jgi:hypothetical protein